MSEKERLTEEIEAINKVKAIVGREEVNLSQDVYAVRNAMMLRLKSLDTLPPEYIDALRTIANLPQFKRIKPTRWEYYDSQWVHLQPGEYGSIPAPHRDDWEGISGEL